MSDFLRILPMSIADLTNEWFETDVLKASLAAGGILGSFVGPRAQGALSYFSTINLENRTARFARLDSSAAASQSPTAIARAAQHFGAKIQTSAEVARILTKSGTATSVVLENGERFQERQLSQAPTLREIFCN